MLGGELNRGALKDAKANAKRNNISNIHFVAADATEYMTAMSENGSKADVVVMDPPRSGSTEEFINAVSRISPSRVVYVSCNPETLGRDLEWFKKKGYHAREAWPVDMFGWTQHVETVVLLSKGMVDNRKVKVDFSLEDMDLSEFKGKATYEQIKVYVLEQTGLKVSNLYIAQIKKKCGLDVGENFNLPKSENAKQPKCTPEKEEAIMQAFKHFGII